MRSSHKPSGNRLWGPLQPFLGAALALSLAGTMIYQLGPWSTELPPSSNPPRPLGNAVSVAGRTVSILGAGDILAHPELWDQARRDGGGVLDFGPMLAAARDTISGADLALCHLETPLAPPGGPYIGFPRFSVPQEVAKGIKSVGYDGCSTASNHSIDQGYDGIKRTLDVLDQAGLGHTGTYLSAKAAKQPKIYQVKGGVRVAHLSYTKNFNGLSRPAGQDWVANLIDPKKIEHDADAARAAGAEIVVVSLHWGTEYEHEPDVDQQTWARQVAAISNVDLVFGHHAHVVQPVEHIGGKWIVYGMGNQIARHAEPVNDNRDGAMIRVTFSPATAKRWKVAAIEAIPTFVDLNPDIRLVDLERSLADSTLPPGRRRIYEAAVDRIQGSLVTRSADDLGLIVRGAATN